MCEKIIKIIALYEFLIYVENRKVYKDILNKYKKVMLNISDGNIKKSILIRY